MDKNKAYTDFLKSLRVALTNISVYFADHPFVVQAITDLKKKIEVIFSFQNPLKVGISAEYLLFGDLRLGNEKSYKETVNFLHQRKIKRIEIRQGFSDAELTLFLTKVNLPPKDIIRQGGLANILKSGGASSILVEDLDYSQLLSDGDQDCQDIWVYLLKNNLKQGNYINIPILSGNFTRIAKNGHFKDLLANPESQELTEGFLSQLKAKNKDQFFSCLKTLMSSLLESSSSGIPKSLDNFKGFLNYLDKTDLADILLEQFKSSKMVNSVNLNLFAKIVDRKKHKEVSSSLSDKLKSQEGLRNDPKVIAGLRDMFSLPTESKISEIYRNGLSSILKDIGLGGSLSFDRNQLRENYHYILLELFNLSQDKNHLEQVLNNLLLELGKAVEANDVKFIKNFIEILKNRKTQEPDPGQIFDKADKFIFNLSQKDDLFGKSLFSSEELIAILKNSSLGTDFYQEIMFKEEKINPYILRLFFRLFPDQISSFCRNLDQKRSNSELVKQIIDNFIEVDPVSSLKVLKYIFAWKNNFFNLRILNLMLERSLCDESFLFPILEQSAYIMRKFTLQILTKSSKEKRKIAQILLDIANPLGLRTKVIRENLQLVKDVPFPEAKEYLFALTKYRFFWNQAIRNKAREILKDYEN
jgi:hypothetical protein